MGFDMKVFGNLGLVLGLILILFLTNLPLFVKVLLGIWAAILIIDTYKEIKTKK